MKYRSLFHERIISLIVQKARIIWLLFSMVFVFTGISTSHAYSVEDCVDCHLQNSSESRLQIVYKDFENSVHNGEADCIECHSLVLDESHMQTQGSGAVDCIQCHDKKNRHGLGGRDPNRPKCYSCHTRHKILPTFDEASSVNPLNLTQTCRRCHPSQSDGKAYFSMLMPWQIGSHLKGNFGKEHARDNCLGCHQGLASHGEDEKIHPDSCNQCHLSADGQSAILGYFHYPAYGDRKIQIKLAAALYHVFLFILLGAGFLHFIRKYSGKA